MQLLVGSGNKGKHIEIAEVLADLDIELLSPADLQISIDPEETGTTFADNALQKARHFFEYGGSVPTVADDSGIIVEALQNELGVYTRRWGAGAEATDEEWIAYFMERMAKEQNKKARFVCNLAYIDEGKKEHLFEGVCEGIITPTLEADYLPGLPISACFKPAGFNVVYSAMTIDQKNSISHRGRAVQQLRDHLA